MRNLPPSDDLALTALRFAAGELSAPQTEAFAERMAHDQAARDALSDAIRLSAAALGQSAPAPDPLRREAVKDELQPTVWSRLVRRRPYRGHPAAWAGLGGAVAAGLTAFGVWLGDPSDERPGAMIPAQLEAGGVAANPLPAGEPTQTFPVRVAIEVAPVPSPVETEPATVVATQPPHEADRTVVPFLAEPKASERPHEVRAGEP